MAVYNPSMSHAVAATGNTAGVMATVSTGTLYMAGGSNVTLSQNGNTVSFVGAVGTGYTTTTQAGTTFGATLGTNGLSMAQPAVLTTARASNDGVGLNTALTANGVSWTVNSSGISMNVPAFLTTAAQSNHSHNFATTTTNGSQIVVGTTNSAGATIGVPSFITTARASNDAVGLNTALTANGVSWTVNSSGISMNVPAFLTTAAQSNISHNLATTTTNGSQIVVGTANSLGATIGVPAFITTYAAQTVDSNKVNTGYTSTTQAGSTVGVTNGSNGLSVAWPPFVTNAAGGGNGAWSLTSNASGTTSSNYGTGFVLAGGSNVTLSGGSNGITFNASQLQGFSASGGSSTFDVLTFSNANNGVSFRNSQGQVVMSHALQELSNTSNITANAINTSQSTLFAQTSAMTSKAGIGTTFAGTNVTGSMTMDSNGLNLALSAGAGGGAQGWGTAALLGNVAGNTTVADDNNNSIYFSGGNNITLSGTGSTIVISAGNAGGGAGTTLGDYEPYAFMSSTLTSQPNNYLWVNSFSIPENQYANVMLFPMAFTAGYLTSTFGITQTTAAGSSSSTATSWTAAQTISAIIYQDGGYLGDGFRSNLYPFTSTTLSMGTTVSINASCSNTTTGTQSTGISASYTYYLPIVSTGTVTSSATSITVTTSGFGMSSFVSNTGTTTSNTSTSIWPNGSTNATWTGTVAFYVPFTSNSTQSVVLAPNQYWMGINRSSATQGNAAIGGTWSQVVISQNSYNSNVNMARGFGSFPATGASTTAAYIPGFGIGGQFSTSFNATAVTYIGQAALQSAGAFPKSYLRYYSTSNTSASLYKHYFKLHDRI